MNTYKINGNIYTTSEEEIKEGDWTFNGEEIYKWTKDDVEDCLYNPGAKNYKGCKKIILTTNQDLINDGVAKLPQQEISDEAKQRAKNYMSLKGALEPKQETFVSKGSDETKEESLVEKMIPHQLKYNLDVMEKLSSTLPQQETLYTEEQVREALSECFKASQEGYNITSNEIIQSLKTKKD